MRTSTFAVSAITSLMMVLPALGQAKSAPPAGGGFGGIVTMMIVMFAIIYFLMIRPEQKKQKERQSLMGNLKKGDKIVTIGGIMGVIHSVKDTSVVIRIADNTNVEFTKVAVATVIKESSEEGKKEEVKKVTEESKDTKEKKK